MTSLYLVRKFNFNDCHYEKNCVLHIMLTFDPALICYFLRSHIMTLPVVAKTINSSSKVTLLVGILINELCSALMLTFEITLIS